MTWGKEKEETIGFCAISPGLPLCTLIEAEAYYDVDFPCQNGRSRTYSFSPSLNIIF
jgi:hypothetical protein